jgi:hypothetical protein
VKLDGLRSATLRAESDDVVNIKPDADALTDGVVMVRWNEREDFGTAGQAQRVEKLGTTERAIQDFRQEGAAVVVNHVVGA